MSEKQFGWNYFENEVVIRDKQDKKRMIVLVFSNFMDIPYNRKSFDELVDWLNEQQATNSALRTENNHLIDVIKEYAKKYEEQQATIQSLKDENENFRKSRDKWKTKALQKDEQLKDCDNDCFNCRFYNKVCDFCTKFHIYTMTSGDKDD